MAERQFEWDPRPVVRHGVAVLPALCLAVLLYEFLPVDGITHWLVHPAAVAGLSWAGQLWYVGRSVTIAAVTNPPYRELLGLANGLTIVRGGLYAVVAGFVVVPSTTSLVWIPSLCYGAGVVLDRVDGAIARTIGQETRIGTRLDTAFDTFGFVVAPLVAVLWGWLPVWYLSLSAARYLYLGGVHWRRLRDRPVFDEPDSNIGKYLAGMQMVFLTVALVPSVSPSLVRTLAPFTLAPSLAVFGRDFMYVSGRLDSSG